MKAALDDKMGAAKDRVASMRTENKEKREYLIEKDKKRDELIKEVKDAFEEEVNQKKEISLLKKRDQQENYERGKNFQYLYKKKLAERLLEKMERGNRVKEQ